MSVQYSVSASVMQRLDSFASTTSQVPEYQPLAIGVGPGETPFSQLAVSTTDTVRMSYIMNELVRKGKFMMLVGTAGTGKTSIVKEYLRRCGLLGGDHRVRFW